MAITNNLWKFFPIRVSKLSASLQIPQNCQSRGYGENSRKVILASKGNFFPDNNEITCEPYYY